MRTENPAWKKLEAEMGERLLYDVPLAALTSLGLGGAARVMARPDSEAELAELLAACRENDWPCFILGGGSNVLFADEGFEGLVIRLGRGFEKIEPDGENGLRAGAAVSSAALMAKAADLNLSGLECLAGIPGSVGGAAAMNAGAGDGALGDRVTELRGLDAGGKPLILANGRDLRYSYRRLDGLPAGAVITAVRLQLAPDSRSAINERTREILKRRGLGQPKGFRNAGCVFKNPPGESAGRLLDACGLKGLAVGGVLISEVHANFFLSRDGATVRDFLELMRRAASAVKARYGIRLEPEIRIISSRGEQLG